MESLVALLHGPDHPGIVAKVSGWIFERSGNIVHADQHRDEEAGVFFQRVEWTPGNTDPAVDVKDFASFASSLGMQARIARSSERARIAIFVSKYDHCFHDLLLRWKAGEFQGEIVAIVSNHPDLEGAAGYYGVPYFYTPVAKGANDAVERRQLEILAAHRVDVVIMARYMQVLSPRFLAAFGRPVINIHHSFLPAFAGGKPYHQAHERGVKLIGATAHYATAVLDDGPIINQDVARVTHRHNVADLVRKGRDLEKIVPARAVAWHLENRILVYGRKTVVFD